ncbi:MAG: hypothetical protein K2X29_03540 [Candidatus Obscuribacterales bacterium]|nr:hypothetical protein [Candidatus Obscuribacterales bacterium]
MSTESSIPQLTQQLGSFSIAWLIETLLDSQAEFDPQSKSDSQTVISNEQSEVGAQWQRSATALLNSRTIAQNIANKLCLITSDSFVS